MSPAQSAAGSPLLLPPREGIRLRPALLKALSLAQPTHTLSDLKRTRMKAADTAAYTSI